MNLKALSAKYNETTGCQVGFSFKSKKTGKMFKTLSLTPSGKFVVCNVGGGNVKEQILCGEADRYEAVNAATEAAMKRAAEIKAELAAVENEIDNLDSVLEAKHEQRAALEDELDGIDYDTNDYDEEEN